TGTISLDADSSLDPMELFEDDIPLIGNVEITSLDLGGAVSGDSGGVAVGGSAVVDVLTFTTTARIGDGAQINQDGLTPGADQSLSITASDTTKLAGGAGGLGGTLGNAGVGIGIAVHVVTKDTRAE